MFIDVKLDNINKFKIIDLKRISFIKKKSYFLKYRIKFNSFRKLYILLSKAFIIRRKIDKSVN